MHDNRFPFLKEVPAQYRKKAEELAASFGCKVLWHEWRESLYFYRGDLSSGCSHEEYMRRPDGTWRSLDHALCEQIKKLVWYARLPLEEKQRLVEEHRARERAKKEAKTRAHLEDIAPEAKMDTRRQLGRKVFQVNGKV